MSQYDDDAERLSDICDNCGEMFADCKCDEDDADDLDDDLMDQLANDEESDL